MLSEMGKKNCLFVFREFLDSQSGLFSLKFDFTVSPFPRLRISQPIMALKEYESIEELRKLEASMEELRNIGQIVRRNADVYLLELDEILKIVEEGGDVLRPDHLNGLEWPSKGVDQQCEKVVIEPLSVVSAKLEEDNGKFSKYILGLKILAKQGSENDPIWRELDGPITQLYPHLASFNMFIEKVSEAVTENNHELLKTMKENVASVELHLSRLTKEQDSHKKRRLIKKLTEELAKAKEVDVKVQKLLQLQQEDFRWKSVARLIGS